MTVSPEGGYRNIWAEALVFTPPELMTAFGDELAKYVTDQKEMNMHVTDEGAVVGSIDRAALAEAEASDAEAKAHLEQLQSEAQAAEEEAAAAAETPEPEAEVEVETEEIDPEATDAVEPMSELDKLREEAGALGIKVDGRWGEERLRDEIAAYDAAEGEE